MAAGASRAIDYSLSEDDFVRCSDYVFRRSMDRVRFTLLRRIALIALALYAAIGIGLRWYGGESLLREDDLLIAIPFFILLLFPYVMRWSAQRTYRSAGFENVRAPMRIEISPTGVRSTGGLGDALTPWSSILDIEVTRDAAYLFILKNSAHIVPRRVFADEAVFDDYVALATRYWRAAAA